MTAGSARTDGVQPLESEGDAHDPTADGPDGDAPSPPRPALVELAAAILIVSGVLGLAGVIGAIPELPAGSAPIVVLTAALNVGSLIVGLSIRTGRAWIVAVNYAAVLGFLDLLGASTSGLALVLGIADVIVVIILFVNKPWFDEMRRVRRERARERRVPSPPVGGERRAWTSPA